MLGRIVKGDVPITTSESPRNVAMFTLPDRVLMGFKLTDGPRSSLNMQSVPEDKRVNSFVGRLRLSLSMTKNFNKQRTANRTIDSCMDLFRYALAAQR